MQGFENMLKMMGFNPQKLLEAAMSEIQPKLDQFMVDIIAKQKEEILTPLLIKLEAMDSQLKKLDPDYVPQDWSNALALPAFVPSVVEVINTDTPEGGAVDMATLDPDKLAAMDHDQGGAAANLGDLSSLEKEGAVQETITAVEKIGEEIAGAALKTVETRITASVSKRLKGKGGIK